MADPLQVYRKKRNFSKTSEPEEGGAPNHAEPAFVIQKHWATRLHYDLRLEVDGVMKSWAVPKGPSFDPKDKRMAVQVEDHPLAYNQFEGEIPKGSYGAGKVIIWDKGTWAPLQDPRTGYRDGMLKFDLHGLKLHGRWALIRIKDRDKQDAKKDEKATWLLIKEKDEFARGAAEYSVVDEMPDSVAKQTTKKKTASSKKSEAGKKSATRKERGKDTSAVAVEHGNDDLPGDKADALPQTLKPQLATLVEGVPADPQDWIFEIKFDGYRMLARVEGKDVRLFTRNGHDWTSKVPHLAQALAGLDLPSAWLDGEIVVLDAHGIPQFQALQNAFDNADTARIVYYLFDVPYLVGRDLRSAPLVQRRALLEQLVAAKKNGKADLMAALRVSEVFDKPPQALLSSACSLGLEGVIGKRRDSPYVTRRSDTWIKMKCSKRQEFVIAGYTDPKGTRVGLGSLLLAVHDENSKTLRYAGNVGTGFDTKALVDIKTRLDAIAVKTSPFDQSTPLDRTAHWVKPVLLAEVSFSDWTTSGSVRHAVFRGLREDKPAKAIGREKATPADQVSKPAKKTKQTQMKKKETADSDTPSTLRVTHPERVIDPSNGITKVELVRFYALVAPLLLEHLKARPTSLVRAPSGVDGQLFFQKHLESKMPGVKTLPQKLDPDHPPLIEIPSLEAVVSAAQMNVMEFHTWNVVKTAIDKPDRMTFDLDPGEGVKWSQMQKAAQLVHAFLQQLGLESFLKTSGGKGWHIVVPVRRQFDWDTVKSFSQFIVMHLADTLPDWFVAKSGPKNRKGKIFVDYLRNGFGATTVAAWSARARPGLGVSVPVAWDEVDNISGGAHWHVQNIHERLDHGNRPWDGYRAQSLSKSMKIIGFPNEKRE